jgi:hypothetical protein
LKLPLLLGFFEGDENTLSAFLRKVFIGVYFTDANGLPVFRLEIVSYGLKIFGLLYSYKVFGLVGYCADFSMTSVDY